MDRLYKDNGAEEPTDRGCVAANGQTTTCELGGRRAQLRLAAFSAASRYPDTAELIPEMNVFTSK